MRIVSLRATLAATFVAVAALPALGQTPSSGNAPLAFDPEAGLWAFRQDGRALVCLRGGACKPLAFDGIAEDRLATAEIVALGRADRVFYVALTHPEIEQGQPRLFRCTADGCRTLSTDPAALTALGTFQVRQRGRTAGRVAILANPLDGSARSRILWCDDDGCAEQAATRNERFDLVYLGRGREEGHTRIWLRDKSGPVIACAQDVEDESASLTCRRTDLTFPNPPDATTTGEADEAALTKALEAALAGGNIAEAERLLAEGQARFPGRLTWASFQGRIAQLRASRDQQQGLAQARRLVAEARRAAQAGDFGTATALLNEAARIAPNLSELPPARAEVARLKAQHDQRLRDRGQYVQAIEQALSAFQLWQAEELIGEAERRFPGDQAFPAYRQRLAQIRARAEWLGRLRRAREHVAEARRAMARGDFGDADRELARAAEAAPGLPEIGQARADLARLRIEAEWQNDEIRQLTSSIDTALRANRLMVAERLLMDGQRRFPRHAGWAGLQRRLDQAKAASGTSAQVQKLVNDARAAIARKDWATADRLLIQAERLEPNAPAVKAARAELITARGSNAGALKGFVDATRAAMARRDWPEAERQLARAERIDPNAPEVKSARADLDAARRSAAGQVTKIVNDARAAIARKDWATADRLLTQAERLDPNAPAVKAARAELIAARGSNAGALKGFVDATRAAMARKDWPEAERQLARAERIDPNAPEVKSARADLDAARKAVAAQVTNLVNAARAAIARKDWAAADNDIKQAERLDPNGPSVKAVRAEFVAAKGSAAAPRFDEAKLRVIFYRLIMRNVAGISITVPSKGTMSMLAAYGGSPNVKALAYCVDWSTARDNFVAAHAAGAHVGGTAAAASSSLALGECGRRSAGQSCTCTMVDVNGGNVLRVPQAVIDRLNK